jgi:aspartate/methionine/tyrosine aminotransferase
MVYDHGWQIDAEAIRRAITPQTRAIVLVHPNNPTGHFTKPWEAAELARLCRQFSLALIVDEVFLDYGTGQLAQRSAAQTFASGLEDIPIFVVSGLSKIAGLPQMKAAWIVTTGPGLTETMARLEVIADTFLSMNAPIQYAIPDWLNSRSEIQKNIRARTGTNLAELDRQLTQAPSAQRLQLEGGWYAILRIAALQPDEQTVRELLDRGVWVHPGYFFGLPESGWLVISLLATQQEFAAGADILGDYLRKHQGSNITQH